MDTCVPGAGRRTGSAKAATRASRPAIAAATKKPSPYPPTGLLPDAATAASTATPSAAPSSCAVVMIQTRDRLFMTDVDHGADRHGHEDKTDADSYEKESGQHVGQVACPGRVRPREAAHPQPSARGLPSRQGETRRGRAGALQGGRQRGSQGRAAGTPAAHPLCRAGAASALRPTRVAPFRQPRIPGSSDPRGARPRQADPAWLPIGARARPAQAPAPGEPKRRGIPAYAGRVPVPGSGAWGASPTMTAGSRPTLRCPPPPSSRRPSG